MADAPLAKYDVSISCGSRNTNGHLPSCSDHWRDLHGGMHPERAYRALGIRHAPGNASQNRVNSQLDQGVISFLERHDYAIKIEPVNGD